MTPARKIALVARNRGKSGTLITEIKASTTACDIVSLDWPEYPDVRRDFDVIVNTTPIGMHPNVEESPLAAELLVPEQIIYDIVYNPERTRLLQDAERRGCRVVGGLGMLVHQGLASFAQWTGKDLPAEVFREGIRRQRELQAGSPA